jgi:hypothetical protein
MSIIGAKSTKSTKNNNANKVSKAESVMSTKSDGGKALDKHCYAINAKNKVKCEGKKISGKNWG